MASDQKKPDTKSGTTPTLGEAARFWWKLGWISFGGTAAHLAIMHTELVEKKRWIDSEHFFHALSHCMLLPGPEATQLAIYIGWKLHGKLGGFIAGTLFVLPSMLILLGLSVLYAECGTVWWVIWLFRGLKPVVIALVLRALFRIGRRALQSRAQWIVAAVSFVSVSLFHISVPWVMCAVLLAGFGAALYKKFRWEPSTTVNTEELRRARARNDLIRVLRITGECTAIGALPLLLLWIWGKEFSFWTQLSGFFTRTAFVTIGGSYTVIPYVAQVAVTKYGWLGRGEMLDGFALAETTPGPLIIVVAFVGFMAGFHHFHGSVVMGTVALLLTTFYTFLPCFLFVFVGAKWITDTHESAIAKSVLRFISSVVVAAILQLAIFLLRGVLMPKGGHGWGSVDVWAAVWIVVALTVLSWKPLRLSGS